MAKIKRVFVKPNRINEVTEKAGNIINAKKINKRDYYYVVDIIEGVIIVALLIMRILGV